MDRFQTKYVSPSPYEGGVYVCAPNKCKYKYCLQHPSSRHTQEADVIDLEECGDYDPGAGYTREERDEEEVLVDGGGAGDYVSDKENNAPPRVVCFDPEMGRAETRQERITRKSGE